LLSNHLNSKGSTPLTVSLLRVPRQRPFERKLGFRSIVADVYEKSITKSLRPDQSLNAPLSPSSVPIPIAAGSVRHGASQKLARKTAPGQHPGTVMVTLPVR